MIYGDTHILGLLLLVAHDHHPYTGYHIDVGTVVARLTGSKYAHHLANTVIQFDELTALYFRLAHEPRIVATEHIG
jgi:hypothetical protein